VNEPKGKETNLSINNKIISMNLNQDKTEINLDGTIKSNKE
jgi:hypothetical protein